LGTENRAEAMTINAPWGENKIEYLLAQLDEECVPIGIAVARKASH
jgi:hypothetical protein